MYLLIVLDKALISRRTVQIIQKTILGECN